MSERELFIAALNMPEPVERTAWLDRLRVEHLAATIQEKQKLGIPTGQAHSEQNVLLAALGEEILQGSALQKSANDDVKRVMESQVTLQARQTSLKTVRDRVRESAGIGAFQLMLGYGLHFVAFF